MVSARRVHPTRASGLACWWQLLCRLPRRLCPLVMLMLSHASQVPLVELPLLPVACSGLSRTASGAPLVQCLQHSFTEASHSSPVYKGNQILGMMGRMVASGRYYLRSRDDE